LGSEDWLFTSWGNLVELKYGKSLRDYRINEGDVPVYGTNGPVGWCDMPLCGYPGVIVGRKGAYRGIHYSSIPFYVIDTAFYVSPKIDINLKWAYYSLLTQDINGMDSGSAIPSTSRDDFYALQAKVPPRLTQDLIVEYLDALNDKIELNRKMNETLECMAQALFKSWFVDFDPVIDKALSAGNPIPEPLQKRASARQALGDKRKPLPADHAKHFPNRFVFSDEMGWVPEGWDVVQMKETALVVKGTSYKSSELADSSTALVTLKSFQRGGGYRLDGLKPYTGKYKPEQEVVAGDLVVAFTDVTQAADVIGKPAMVIDDARFDHLVVSLDVAVVRPSIGRHKYFLYGEAQTDRFQRHTHSYSTGTTVLHLGKNAVPDYFLLMPDEKLLNRYIDIVEPSYQKTNKNIGQLRELEKTRDVLLPKLLSGELQIPDAEKLIQEVQ